MDLLTVLLRLIHVTAGAVWVGLAVFVGLFLAPSLQEVGPAGGKVMAALQRRGLLTVMPLLALATLLSGAWLYWRASLGLRAGWVTSPPGITFALGGVAALVGYAIGISVVRPAALRMTALARELEGPLSESERAVRMAEIGRLRGRGARAGRIVALLLLAATAAMGVARYL